MIEPVLPSTLQIRCHNLSGIILLHVYSVKLIISHMVCILRCLGNHYV